jgi:hypothetical protein
MLENSFIRDLHIVKLKLENFKINALSNLTPQYFAFGTH